MPSVAKLMGMDFVAPDFSTLSRHDNRLQIAQIRRATSNTITLIVDSTILRTHSGADWQEQKHDNRKTHKTWRKLHIGLDPNSDEIAVSELTTELAGDETVLPNLLIDIDTDVSRFLAGSTYDGQGVADCRERNAGRGWRSLSLHRRTRFEAQMYSAF